MTKATREALGDALMEMGDNKKVVVLCADLTDSTKTGKFEEHYPDRFFQCGVAEQNMVGMATGFALDGKIPFVTTFSAFVPFRALDQIRVSVCYNDANVKLASTHAGLTLGEDGATHQALEDIAVMRSLPNMTVIVPCDYEEARKAIIESAKLQGPVYIRLGRAKIPEITKRSTPFHIGRAEFFKKGNDVTIIACGVMVERALSAAEQLHDHGIDAEVINCHTVKPIDSDKILSSAKKTGCVVTVEEHQIFGGLGSAVSEVLSSKYPVPIEFVGVKDTFGESGDGFELLEKYQLTDHDIMKAVDRVLRRRNK